MNWWAIIEIVSTWACALGAITCAFTITRLIRFQSKAHRETMASLTEIADTYHLGWQVLNGDLEQLRARIAELEAK